MLQLQPNKKIISPQRPAVTDLAESGACITAGGAAPRSSRRSSGRWRAHRALRRPQPQPTTSFPVPIRVDKHKQAYAPLLQLLLLHGRRLLLHLLLLLLSCRLRPCASVAAAAGVFACRNNGN